MRKLHAVNDDEGGKKQVRKKGGRAERRSKRQADEKARRLRRVGRRRADIHERGSGGEGGRREKDFLCRFAAETNCRLPHFHDLYKSRHLTPFRRLESQSPHSRLEGGAAVATFTIPSSFSNAGGSKHKRRFAPFVNPLPIRYLARCRYLRVRFIDQASTGLLT